MVLNYMKVPRTPRVIRWSEVLLVLTVVFGMMACQAMAQLSQMFGVLCVYCPDGMVRAVLRWMQALPWMTEGVAILAAVAGGGMALAGARVRGRARVLVVLHGTVVGVSVFSLVG